jgi:hypothetical protein
MAVLLRGYMSLVQGPGNFAESLTTRRGGSVIQITDVYGVRGSVWRKLRDRSKRTAVGIDFVFLPIHISGSRLFCLIVAVLKSFFYGSELCP